MDYSFDQFASLVAVIDEKGGALLPDECEPQVIKYKMPPKGRIEEANTCHCGNESMFVLPYELTGAADSKDAKSRGGGFARVCGVCDDVGRWPLYEEAPA